jgi:hypothetical protein
VILVNRSRVDASCLVFSSHAYPVDHPFHECLSMALNSSPRKQIPLATGEETPRKASTPSLTKRVFYCGVVVEGCDSGRRLPEGE